MFLFLLLPMLQAWAQEDVRSFDQNKLEDLWSEEEFDQTKKMESVPFYGSEPLYANQIDDTFGDGQGRARSLPSSNTFSGNGEAAQTFMYIIAGLFLLSIIFFVLKNTVRGSGQNLHIDSLSHLGDGDLQALDTHKLIAQATGNKDYRLAVRLQYLDVLKNLDEKKWIKWTANKTNQDYVRELAKHKLGPSFNTLTYHFDYTWYGDFHIEENLYKKLESQFQEFQLKIKGKR